MTVIEHVARAICQATGLAPDAIEIGPNPNWMADIQKARAAIQALADNVSEEMAVAGRRATPWSPTIGGPFVVPGTIRAALLAALGGK